ncbi:hypothetical protein TNCV_142121 [Trichonephila clavipes]|nr:hypothetical protein TNCV_142121 [Trichonephila clavipes]
MHPDAVAHPVAVVEEKDLPRDSSNVPLISAEDEKYEEREETPVDVLKDKVKDDLIPVIFSKERVDINDDEIEEGKPKLAEEKKLSRMTVAE